MLTIIISSLASAGLSALVVTIVIRVRTTKKLRKEQLAAARLALAVQSAASEEFILQSVTPSPVYNEVSEKPDPPPLPPNHPELVTKSNKAYGIRTKT